MTGEAMDFSEADLAACAAAYNPALHEAPIVIGHPAANAPAYGWVKSLSAQGGNLTAEPHQVDPAFAELVAAGRYKKISASFYLPTSPTNPKPGALYLRHVGFLGALPPSVKGLRAPVFAEGEEGVVEFGDWAQDTNASLWRRLREWLLAQFGPATADQVVPDWNIEALKDAAREDADEEAEAKFSEAPKTVVENTTVTPEQIAAIQAENEQLKERNAALEASAQREASERLHAANASFAESLVADGRLAPKDTALVVALLDQVSAAPIDFGEGDIAGAFRAFLSSAAKVVDFGEHATKGKAATDTSDAAVREFAEKNVDSERLTLHVRACALAAEKGIPYGIAIRQVISQ